MGLDTVEIIMEIEQEFSLSIPDADAEQFHRVGNLIDYVWKRLQKAPPEAWRTGREMSRAARTAAIAAGRNPAEPPMVTRELVELCIRQIVASVIGLKLEDVHADSRFVEDLGAD